MILVIQEREKGGKYTSLLHADLINLRVIDWDGETAGMRPSEARRGRIILLFLLFIIYSIFIIYFDT
jgi:hypothetical protein